MSLPSTLPFMRAHWIGRHPPYAANRDAEQLRVLQLDFGRYASSNPVSHTLYRARGCQPQQLRKTCRATVVGNDFMVSHAAIKRHV